MAGVALAGDLTPLGSIKAPEVDVDLRTEVANRIGVPVEIET